MLELTLKKNTEIQSSHGSVDTGILLTRNFGYFYSVCQFVVYFKRLNDEIHFCSRLGRSVCRMLGFIQSIIELFICYEFKRKHSCIKSSIDALSNAEIELIHE